MSFILDALKKSESDRQRQSGPALFEVKLAPPRTGLPPWGLAVGALLLVNLGVVMWMLLRHAATPAPGTPPVAAAGASAPPLPAPATAVPAVATDRDRKSTRLNSSHRCISYAVFCLKKKTQAF